MKYLMMIAAGLVLMAACTKPQYNCMCTDKSVKDPQPSEIMVIRNTPEKEAYAKCKAWRGDDTAKYNCTMMIFK